MKMFKDLFHTSDISNSVGLCLSGGGALGFSHIGALQALEDHRIFATHISGSSMGAIIGAFYAAGFSPATMLQLIKEDKLYKITKLMSFRPTFLKSGLSSHFMLRSLVNELIPHNSFEQLTKKLHVCVVNLNTSEWEIKESGNELDIWLSATASIPGLFETIIHDDTFFVDGGLLNNMPAQCLKEHCKMVIGVDVIPQRKPKEIKKTIDTLTFSVRAMQHHNSKEGRSYCDFLIESDAIEKFNEFSFDSFQEIYQYGYSATTKYIVEHTEIMKLAKHN